MTSAPSKNTIKSGLVFLLTGILLMLIVAANFYRLTILSDFPFLPHYSVPGISICVLLIIGLAFWVREREIDRLKYEFLTIVTHKFRTPLTGIKWAIEVLRHDLTISQKEDLLKQMEGTNERLMEIVDLLVGFVKFDDSMQYAYEATSLREIVDAALIKYGQRMKDADLGITIKSPNTLPLIIIDKRKIQFVIDMLLDNAIKYTPKGGAIQITISYDTKHVLIAVADNGIGIMPEDMRSLFKRFFRSSDAKRADTEGMGLGLYTIKTIVEKHGGKIWAESGGRNKGSTFYVQLNMK